MKKCKLLVFPGFSGVGKGTVVKYLKDHKDTYNVSGFSKQQENQDQMKSQEVHYITFK